MSAGRVEGADVVVIGAGPAGIAAAVAAAEAGVTTLLLDQAATPGGQIWRGDHPEGAPWLERLRAAGVRFEGSTTVFDAPAPRHLLAERNGSPISVIAERALVLATGARELFLPFPGWTLPGVVGVGGAQALLKTGWDVRGRTAVVAGTGPLLLPVAAALRHAGARVSAVIEQTTPARLRRFAFSLWRSPARAVAAARYRWAWRSARHIIGGWVCRADGDSHIAAVRIRGPVAATLTCDLLCTGYGLHPATELAQLLGCSVSQRGVDVDELQQTTVPHVYCAGEAVKVGGADAAIVQGRIAGLTAAGRGTEARALFRERSRHAAFEDRMRVAFALRPELSLLADDDTIVCRCEDVAFGSVARCDSAREAKLHTRLGMGACQGRVCGGALSHLRGWSADGARPPLTPTRIGIMIERSTGDESHAEE
jgi:D-hydroxyproline dehydrogenase subunit alpha